MNNDIAVQTPPSAGVKFFGGTVSGLTAAMVSSSLLYLVWFIPLGRPSSNFFFNFIEVVILTSTCLVAAYFAALYGREQDEGDGKPSGGSLLLPTLIGTVAGAVVLWLLFSVLVAKPAAAHPQHPPAHPEVPGTPPDASAAHGSQAPASPPRAEAVHDEHAPQDWSLWLAENSNVAELFSYLLGTIVAAAAGVLAPRPATKPATMNALAH